jgi:carbonic anhydrase/acetyltransferase-like protein (isoleucine patch superfamily)
MKRLGPALEEGMPIYALENEKPQLPEAGHYWIAPGAHVIGRVKLGVEVTVWFNAVIRADNDLIEIGERSNIQDNAVVHADPGFPVTVGAGCTIGHRAILHGCTIGPNTLIGMGAVLLNGARIGANSIVGANALVTEGKEFPDNSLIVGTPAKLVRTLDETAIARLPRDAEAYMKKLGRYVAGLKPLGA